MCLNHRGGRLSKTTSSKRHCPMPSFQPRGSDRSRRGEKARAPRGGFAAPPRRREHKARMRRASGFATPGRQAMLVDGRNSTTVSTTSSRAHKARRGGLRIACASHRCQPWSAKAAARTRGELLRVCRTMRTMYAVDGWPSFVAYASILHR